MRIVEAQEEERGRIARELHDEFGQHLASVLLGLRLVEQAGVADEARDAMAELVQTINAAISQLRTLAIELRPTALDDFGLVPALERLTESYSRRTGVLVELAVDEISDRLPPLVETTVYRVVQESLTNVAKHAGAESVIVRGEVRGSELVVTVTDDGKGFDPNNQPGGFGLELDAGAIGDGVGHRASDVLAGRGHDRRAAGAQMMRVLIVDDHALVRAGIALLLGHQDDMEPVGQAGTARRGHQARAAS